MWARATKKAVSSGLAGMTTQAMNVCALMWMRTIMMYQYRHGGAIPEVARKLWAEGGAMRFYRGLGPSLLLAPAMRFCDTASNDGWLAVLEGTGMSLAAKTLVASNWAAAIRVVFLPLDAWATMKQVEGKEGLRHLVAKARARPASVWQGAGGMYCASLVGHYSWFLTSNSLCGAAPCRGRDPWATHAQNAAIGFTSGAVSDVCSNSLWVLKTLRQTLPEPVPYPDLARRVVAKEGLRGLFGRGLKMRVLTNGTQGAFFTVGWKALSQALDQHH